MFGSPVFATAASEYHFRRLAAGDPWAGVEFGASLELAELTLTLTQLAAYGMAAPVLRLEPPYAVMAEGLTGNGQRLRFGDTGSYTVGELGTFVTGVQLGVHRLMELADFTYRPYPGLIISASRFTHGGDRRRPNDLWTLGFQWKPEAAVDSRFLAHHPDHPFPLHWNGCAIVLRWLQEINRDPDLPTAVPLPVAAALEAHQAHRSVEYWG